MGVLVGVFFLSLRFLDGSVVMGEGRLTGGGLSNAARRTVGGCAVGD